MEDEEKAVFCDCLLGLMQRMGRFDHLDLQEDPKLKAYEKSQRRSAEKTTKRRSLKQ